MKGGNYLKAIEETSKLVPIKAGSVWEARVTHDDDCAGMKDEQAACDCEPNILFEEVKTDEW